MCSCLHPAVRTVRGYCTSKKSNPANRTPCRPTRAVTDEFCIARSLFVPAYIECRTRRSDTTYGQCAELRDLQKNVLRTGLMLARKTNTVSSSHFDFFWFAPFTVKKKKNLFACRKEITLHSVIPLHCYVLCDTFCSLQHARITACNLAAIVLQSCIASLMQQPACVRYTTHARISSRFNTSNCCLLQTTHISSRTDVKDYVLRSHDFRALVKPHAPLPITLHPDRTPSSTRDHLATLISSRRDVQHLHHFARNFVYRKITCFELDRDRVVRELANNCVSIEQSSRTSDLAEVLHQQLLELTSIAPRLRFEKS